MTAADIYENFAEFTMSAAKAARYAALTLGSREPKSVAVIAPSYRQAALILRNVESVASWCVPYGQSHGVSWQMSKISVSNGTVVRVVSFDQIYSLRGVDLDGVIVLDPLAATPAVQDVVRSAVSRAAYSRMKEVAA